MPEERDRPRWSRIFRMLELIVTGQRTMPVVPLGAIIPGNGDVNFVGLYSGVHGSGGLFGVEGRVPIHEIPDQALIFCTALAGNVFEKLDAPPGQFEGDFDAVFRRPKLLGTRQIILNDDEPADGEILFVFFCA